MLEKNVAPRYDQITLNKEDRKNTLQQVLSPTKDDAGVWIHQDAWFHMGLFDQGIQQTYAFKKENNGVYAFILEGSFTISGNKVSRRDGIGIWDTDHITIPADENNAEILLMEVPMKF